MPAKQRRTEPHKAEGMHLVHSQSDVHEQHDHQNKREAPVAEERWVAQLGGATEDSLLDVPGCPEASSSCSSAPDQLPSLALVLPALGQDDLLEPQADGTVDAHHQANAQQEEDAAHHKGQSLKEEPGSRREAPCDTQAGPPARVQWKVLRQPGLGKRPEKATGLGF